MPSFSDAARALLRANDRGAYTVPSPRLYPHQWAWDSAFAAIGWLHVDPDRALVELETLMATQWEDGRIPHIYFHQPSDAYFPPPAMWGRERSTTITQPPAWAMAARRALEFGIAPARVKALLSAIERSHAYFHAQRDPLGLHLVVVTHPWESGMDNSPNWDPAMHRLSPDGAPELKRVDKERVTNASQRPTDDDYRRYLKLVKAIEANGFGLSPLQVYDPFMTAMLARAESDLAWLGGELGFETAAGERAARMRQALVERLWDEELGRFKLLDAVTGEFHAPDTLGCHMPLMLGLPAPVASRLEAALRGRYWTTFPLPSTAPEDPAFQPDCYWRGPSWVNMNWLLAPALGEDLVDVTLAQLERHGFWEYFHPLTGAPLGADQFTWSAALALDWLASYART